MQRPARFIFPGWVVLIFLMLCGGGGFVSILIKSSSAPPIPALGDPISLRGDRVAILRLPTAPIQEIAVYADGHANRYAHPIIPNAYTQIQFSPAEQQEFEQLRTAW